MITVKLSDLEALLEEAATFTSRDRKLPISGVLFERQGDNLVAIATDRFRIAVTRIEAEYSGASDPDNWALDSHALKTFRSSVATAKMSIPVGERPKHDVTIESEGDQLTVQLPGLSFTLTLADGEGWPDWRGLFQRFTYGRTRTQARTNASYLADFRKPARSKSDSMLVEFADTATGPMRITIGNHFVGLLMPLDIKTDFQLTIHDDLRLT